MNYKVAKFGGSSLSTREHFESVLDLIMQDSQRRFVVLSAPGKRFKTDKKVTDLLIAAGEEYPAKTSANEIKKRLFELTPDNPEVRGSLETELNRRLGERNVENYSEVLKAFGEYASARLMTEFAKSRGIEARFMDPKDIGFVVLNHRKHPEPDPNCYSRIRDSLAFTTPIPITFIPGFYGYDETGLLRTLPRGGSDTSGAVIANAVNASMYENMTDEDGLRRADPSVVENPELIEEITYVEARELAPKGFKLQEDSLLPLMGTYIQMTVRNSANTNNNGSLIVEERLVSPDESIVGVSSKPGYLSINIYKKGMNNERGFGRKVFQVLDEEDVSYEHVPTGNDNMSIIVEKSEITGTGKLNYIFGRINREAGPLQIKPGEEEISLVAVAGLGMRRHRNVPSRVLNALSSRSIYPITQNMGATDISYFVGVEEKLGHEAVRAIYREFFGGKE